MPSTDTLAEAFLWEERRQVRKTACVSLHGNVFQVDPALVGRRVELVFDPFDMTTIEVRYRGVPHGLAIPHKITRHSHPKARPETTDTEPAKSTGINYLGILAATDQNNTGEHINFHALARHDTAAGPQETQPAATTPTDPDTAVENELAGLATDQVPGQLDLTDLLPDTLQQTDTGQVA